MWYEPSTIHIIRNCCMKLATHIDKKHQRISFLSWSGKKVPKEEPHNFEQIRVLYQCSFWIQEVQCFSKLNLTCFFFLYKPRETKNLKQNSLDNDSEDFDKTCIYHFQLTILLQSIDLIPKPFMVILSL